VRVRAATMDDAAAVREVADAAWRDTYAGQLRPETIEAFIDRSYSMERLHRRIANDLFVVALDADERIVAFANARAEDDRFDLLAIYARPEARGQGAGTAMLAAVRAAAGARPVAADVLLGNRKGETFYEARGFVPGETLEVRLFEEIATLRRWWLAAAPAAAPAATPT